MLLKQMKKIQPTTPSPEVLVLCHGYMYAAREDSWSARILYRHGMSALTIYHIQQAAEKATKALCLSIGLTTPELLGKDHRTPRPLLQALGQDLLRGIRRLLGNIEGKDYRKVLKDVNRLVNNEPKVVAKLPFASSGRQIGIDTLLRNFDIFSQKEQVLEGIEHTVVTTLAEHLPEYREMILGYSRVEFGRAAVMCYILGVLTFAHENTTRYPGGHLEPEDYKGDLGIVQAIPDLLKRTPLMIASVQEVLGQVRKNMHDS